MRQERRLAGKVNGWMAGEDLLDQGRSRPRHADDKDQPAAREPASARRSKISTEKARAIAAIRALLASAS